MPTIKKQGSSARRMGNSHRELLEDDDEFNRQATTAPIAERNIQEGAVVKIKDANELGDSDLGGKDQSEIDDQATLIAREQKSSIKTSATIRDQAASASTSFAEELKTQVTRKKTVNFDKGRITKKQMIKKQGSAAQRMEDSPLDAQEEGSNTQQTMVPQAESNDQVYQAQKVKDVNELGDSDLGGKD